MTYTRGFMVAAWPHHAIIKTNNEYDNFNIGWGNSHKGDMPTVEICPMRK